MKHVKRNNFSIEPGDAGSTCESRFLLAKWGGCLVVFFGHWEGVSKQTYI